MAEERSCSTHKQREVVAHTDREKGQYTHAEKSGSTQKQREVAARTFQIDASLPRLISHFCSSLFCLMMLMPWA